MTKRYVEITEVRFRVVWSNAESSNVYKCPVFEGEEPPLLGPTNA